MRKKLTFTEGVFLTSAVESKGFPLVKNDSGKPLPEIAFVGRSNVGKSSLLNHLLKMQKLAKTSATPGKTATLNFFLVDEELILVDLPGYGFARKSKQEQKIWAAGIDTYLSERTSLKLILLLLDMRHLPSEEDLIFLQWLESMEKPFLLIFTKTDKLSLSEQKHQAMHILETIKDFGISAPCDYVSYSIKDKDARNRLLTRLRNYFYGITE